MIAEPLFASGFDNVTPLPGHYDADSGSKRRQQHKTAAADILASFSTMVGTGDTVSIFLPQSTVWGTE